jgi:hypothetical protein
LVRNNPEGSHPGNRPTKPAMNRNWEKSQNLLILFRAKVEIPRLPTGSALPNSRPAVGTPDHRAFPLRSSAFGPKSISTWGMNRAVRPPQIVSYRHCRVR